MQTIKQAEIARISVLIYSNMSVPKSITDISSKRILDGNYDRIPLKWRKTQNEILIYALNCTISYDIVTGELVKCNQSNMYDYLQIK